MIIGDQERHGRGFREMVFARAGDRRIGEFFETRVRLALDHAITLLNRRPADRLREMTLAGTGRARNERVLSLRDEARRRRFVAHGDKVSAGAKGLDISRKGVALTRPRLGLRSIWPGRAFRAAALRSNRAARAACRTASGRSSACPAGSGNRGFASQSSPAQIVGLLPIKSF